MKSERGTIIGLNVNENAFKKMYVWIVEISISFWKNMCNGGVS